MNVYKVNRDVVVSECSYSTVTFIKMLVSWWMHEGDLLRKETVPLPGGFGV